ncbi:MAG: GNAT family N-acetyltransferase [Tetrasphaera sp.]
MSAIPEVQLVRTRAELCAAAGADDAFARLDPPEVLDEAYALGATVGWLRTSITRKPSFTAWGPRLAEFIDALSGAGVLDGLRLGWITVPRSDFAVVGQRFALRAGGDWDWMWTDGMPAVVPGEERLVALDDTRDAAEITAFAARENPRFEGHPGTGQSASWLGVRDEAGDLVACGAIQRLGSGVAHLAGILSAERVRGQGLGRAISAALTRGAVEREGVCTLGMYADNTVARTLYHSLGYRTDKEWASRLVARMTPAATDPGDQPPASAFLTCAMMPGTAACISAYV